MPLSFCVKIVCLSFVFTVAVKLVSGKNSTLAEKFKVCLEPESNQSGPQRVYLNCVDTPKDSTVKVDCGIDDISNCITYLADIQNFQECIGPENLKTLRESSELFHAHFKHFCADGGAVLAQFMEHGGVKCQQEHKAELDRCRTDADITIAETAPDIEKMSGYVYDEAYCRSLKIYHNCTVNVMQACHQSAVDYSNIFNDLRWNALPCSGSQVFPVPAIILSSASLLVVVTKLMKF